MKKVLFITLMIICIFYVQGQDRYKCNITFKFEAGSFGGGFAYNPNVIKIKTVV